MSGLTKLFLVATALALLSTPAYAYIDPGSGSMILQGLLAALAAIAVTAKLWWHRLLVLLHLRKRSVVPSSQNGSNKSSAELRER